MEEFEEQCKNCGFSTFELIDGHYYCVECHEQFDDVAKKEHDEFAFENIKIEGVKRKDPQKNLEKDREALIIQKTSYEEYNLILHGLVNEILQIEYIPGFQVTVLQLWIHYLKKYEVAFFENENLNHLPKLGGVYREKDAQILYNKQPKTRKKKSYYKKKTHTTAEIEGDTKEARKMRRQLVRKSVKKIAKQQMETEMYSQTSNSSALSNLTFEDVATAQKGIELAIEVSAVGKETQQKVIERHMNAGRALKRDKNGEVIVKANDLIMSESVQILRGSIIISILYSALNICGSNFQLADLLRLCNDGYISYYSFRKFLPDFDEKTKLAMEQFFSFYPLNFFNSRHSLYLFYDVFPDIKLSLRTPNLLMLVRRYVTDMNLPSAIAKYAERFMELLPSQMKIVPFRSVQNYEGRAMGYVLFVLKYIFGIDGYREKEMSESARKINEELKRLNIDQQLFVYEDWRASIEYRDTILCKYFYPTITRKTEFKGEKPYLNYLAKLKAVRQTTKYVHQKAKARRNTEEKKEFIKSILIKLQKFHENDPVHPIDRLQFNWSFTPQHDAFKIIIEDAEIKPTINEQFTCDYTNTICDYYLKSDELVKLLDDHGFKIKAKKCTFPKTFAFKKISSTVSKNYINLTHKQVKFDISVDEETWKKDFIKQERTNAEQEEKNKIKFHNKKMTAVIKKRLIIQRQINAKNHVEEEPETDEIVGKLEEFSDDDEPDEDEAESLEFITSDFNFWYRKFTATDIKMKSYSHEFKNFPKSFQWLLEAAANVTHQDIEAIYFQLLIIESQLVEKYKPLELTDYNLVEAKEFNRPPGNRFD